VLKPRFHTSIDGPKLDKLTMPVTLLLGDVLAGYVPPADELDTQTQYLVDGTLLPCWSWASHPELYSGKYKTTRPPA
jgi:hypothetical protein